MNHANTTMRNILIFSCCLAGFFLFAGKSSFAQSGYTHASVGWPVFKLRSGETHCAGKAFAIKWYRGRTLLLMPLHLLSPEAGFSHYVNARDVAGVVSEVEIQDLAQQSVLATVSSADCLLKTGTTVGMGKGDLNTDLMAFELRGSSKLDPLQISGTLPKVGSEVYVLTKDMHATSSQPDRFAGKVARADVTGLTIRMDSPLTALSSSGAPVVNEKNELVGMMLGKQDESRMVIMAAPAATMFRRLYAEVGNR